MNNITTYLLHKYLPYTFFLISRVLIIGVNDATDKTKLRDQVIGHTNALKIVVYWILNKVAKIKFGFIWKFSPIASVNVNWSK